MMQYTCPDCGQRGTGTPNKEYFCYKCEHKVIMLPSQNGEIECTYPECRCPFDMGEDNKCFRGFKQ